jgi:hypothetical protein
MCPACIESAAVMVAGVASTGGILAVCIGKVRRFFRASGSSFVSESIRKSGEMKWQSAKR